MNKKVLGLSVIFTMFLLLFFLNITPAKETEDGQAITMLEDAGGYVLEDNELVANVAFMKNESFTYSAEDDSYYYLPFGNGEVMIKKEFAEKSTAGLTEDMLKGDKTVITTEPIAVTNRTLLGRNIGSISPNLRLPIISETKNHYEINMGGKPGYVLKSDTKVDQGIPVLMYHHLIENRDQTEFVDNNMVIDLLDFQEQMAYLKENDWKTISLEDLDDWLHFKKDLPDRVVVITFDDGLLSLTKYAYPLLKDYEFKATAFLIGRKIRQQAKPWSEEGLQYIGLKEIRETKDLFDYQHHTNHMHLRGKDSGEPFLTTSTYDEIRSDIADGKLQISKAFDFDQTTIRYLAYPFGKFNSISKQAIEDSGIRLAFTTNTGNVTLGDDLFELNRQGVGPNHSLTDYKNKLEGTFK